MREAILASFLGFQVLLVLALGGCGGRDGPAFDAAGVRALSVSGHGFAATAAREYQALALDAVDLRKNWGAAARFGDKALAAAEGIVPAAENPAGRPIAEARLGEIFIAYNRLTDALEGGAARRTPTTAAIAQARFDCWVERAAANQAGPDIEPCRDAFHGAIGTLEMAAREGGTLVVASPAE